MPKYTPEESEVAEARRVLTMLDLLSGELRETYIRNNKLTVPILNKFKKILAEKKGVTKPNFSEINE